MLNVLSAGFFGGIAPAEVLVSLGKSQPALVDRGNLSSRILEVLLLSQAKKRVYVN